MQNTQFTRRSLYGSLLSFGNYGYSICYLSKAFIRIIDDHLRVTLLNREASRISRTLNGTTVPRIRFQPEKSESIHQQSSINGLCAFHVLVVTDWCLSSKSAYAWLPISLSLDKTNTQAYNIRYDRYSFYHALLVSCSCCTRIVWGKC